MSYKQYSSDNQDRRDSTDRPRRSSKPRDSFKRDDSPKSRFNDKRGFNSNPRSNRGESRDANQPREMKFSSNTTTRASHPAPNRLKLNLKEGYQAKAKSSNPSYRNSEGQDKADRVSYKSQFRRGQETTSWNREAGDRPNSSSRFNKEKSFNRDFKNRDDRGSRETFPERRNSYRNSRAQDIHNAVRSHLSNRASSENDSRVNRLSKAAVAETQALNNHDRQPGEDTHLRSTFRRMREQGRIVNSDQEVNKFSLGAKDKQVRVQKILANLGYGSRRYIDDLISQGLVTVNDTAITLGATIDPEYHNLEIKIAGQKINLHGTNNIKCRMVAYNKRSGEASTNSDPLNRRTVFDRLPPLNEGRWVQVGRLDINTYGLLLFTTDGELANRLMHPKYEIERQYLCRVYGGVTQEKLEQLKKGVQLEDGISKFETIQPLSNAGSNQMFIVSLKQGKNHEVKRLWESQGNVVSRLTRISFADYNLSQGLPQGGWEELDAVEINRIRNQVGLEPIAVKYRPKAELSSGNQKREDFLKKRRISRAINKVDGNDFDSRSKRRFDSNTRDQRAERHDFVTKIRQARKEKMIEAAENQYADSYYDI